jgi:hypothetical protein
MSQAQVVAVLTRAREYVDQGWVQGRSRSLDGKRRCAGQAITDAWVGLVLDKSHPTEEEKVVFDEASRLLLEAVPTYAANIPYWNDNVVKHKSDVLAVFDEAIVLAKRESVEVETPVEDPVPFATFMVIDLTTAVEEALDVTPSPEEEAPKSFVQKVLAGIGV